MRAGILIAITVVSIGCVGSDKNTDCRWSTDHRPRVLDLSRPADRRHLADDAQTAEDLAIRFADASRRPDWQRNREQYQQTREECRARLNVVVSQEHSVPTVAVAAAVTDRRAWLDGLVLITFCGLFVTMASGAAAWLLRGALRESRAVALVLLLPASLGAGAVGVLGSSAFVGVIESLRIGNGHMSYRVERLPLRHRRVETFAAGTLCFILIGAIQFQRNRSLSSRQA